jgi:hypothetical protein
MTGRFFHRCFAQAPPGAKPVIELVLQRFNRPAQSIFLSVSEAEELGRDLIHTADLIRAREKAAG